MKGEGCGKSSEKAQETKLLTVTHTWCQSVPWESVPAPLCTPSIAGGGDWQKQTHPHLLQAPNLIHKFCMGTSPGSVWANENGVSRKGCLRVGLGCLRVDKIVLQTE